MSLCVYKMSNLNPLVLTRVNLWILFFFFFPVLVLCVEARMRGAESAAVGCRRRGGRQKAAHTYTGSF